MQTRIGGGECFDDAAHGRIHLVGILDGLQNLFVESSGAAIPEEPVAGTTTDEGGSVPLADAPIDADGEGPGVGKTMVGIVAGGTGDRAVGGELLFEEELPAEHNEVG